MKQPERFKSRVTFVEAFQYGPQWRPGLVHELAEFISGAPLRADAEVVAFVVPDAPWNPPKDATILILAGKNGAQGWVRVPLGHWVVRLPGDHSNHWPIDPRTFAERYEKLQMSCSSR